MTPEEKLLALIQQDKRQAGNVTPQEKLLALIEEDKKKPEPVAVPASPVVVATPPVPVVKPTPVPPAPVAKAVPLTPPVAPIPAPAKKPELAVAPMAQSMKRDEAPTLDAPKEGIKKNPKPMPVPSSVGVAETQDSQKTEPAPPRDLAAKDASLTGDGAGSSLSQPLIFPTIRVSGVTITNRVLGVLVVLLIVAVFYSVAGTERSINAEIQKQLKGAGEMSVAPVAVSEEPLPSVEDLVDKVSKRNYFAPITFEKNNAGGGASVVVAGAMKDLKLVAVSMDAAAPSESMGIVRNKADSKTYFVKVGESVGDTGLILVKVLADRLVLKQGKQEIELK